uniref:Putative secreted protein n=1 Tax=Anopheles darlingi TaxID=43151 RepID=A0A2M4D950_ANODA
MASMASRSAVTTLVFFSLNFSKIAGTHAPAYVLNFLPNPLANIAKHLPPSATRTTFVSFVITFLSARTTSPYSPGCSFGF